MENKEHIDRLYQEKFKDFEVTPNLKVWKNIEASLQKKKHRFLPFWWISGGAVATLLIGLLFYPFSPDGVRNKKIKEEIITEVEEQKLIHFKEEFQIEEHTKPEILKNEEEVIVNIKIDKTPNKGLIKNNKNVRKKQVLNKEIIAVVAEDESKKKVENTSNFNKYLKKQVNEEHINHKIVKQKKEVVADKNNYKVLPTKPKKETKDLVALNDKEEEKTKERLPKKWSLTPSIAFLNSGSFSKSSPLGSSLNDNNISGEKTYSYGIKIAYKINDKWEVQSGIHLQEVQFNTQNVVFRNSKIDSKLNINYFRDETLVFGPSPDTPVSSEGSGFVANNATVNQSFGYVEIPIEIKYILFKKSKFSTQLVTGISSLFLSKNKVNASSTDFSGFVGETNNLNTLNFSGNIGLDINYQLFKKLKLNVNPMFKQQLNTFSKNANGFKPYSIGIYTGIRYEF